jgi:hypothetical protein
MKAVWNAKVLEQLDAPLNCVMSCTAVAEGGDQLDRERIIQLTDVTEFR